MEHADAPFLVETPAEAAAAGHRLQNEFVDYQAIEHAGGHDIMDEVLTVQQDINQRNLFNNALENGDPAVVNVAFLDLLRQLVTLSSLLQSAQDDDNVWVRNWQWPVSLQVRTMSGAALRLTAGRRTRR